MSHQPAVKLAGKISELLGAEYQTFFSNSGSEANEAAFKIARQYHNQTGNPGKYKIISRYRAYHGSTLGALSATAQANRDRKKHTSELQSRGHLVCRLLLEKKKKT